ncbi:MAG: gnl 3, partial [Pedosphaera sp.]|nr:gnl 3 [Pedosphaera sp.]
MHLHPVKNLPNIPFNLMKQKHLALILLLAALPGLNLFAADAKMFKPEPGYISLFNGHDLTGWGYVTNNCDGKTDSSDGRYTAKDGLLVVNP